MKKKFTILLTGATGLVGEEILNELVKHDFTINAIYRNHKVDVGSINWVKFDVLVDSFKYLVDSINDIDVIIHCAASLKIGENEVEIKELQEVNIDFTKKLIDLAIDKKVKKFIFLSTLSFIEKPLPTLITEKSKLNPLSFYSKSKLKGEELIMNSSKKHGFTYSILRISSPIVNEINKMHNTVVRKWIEIAENNGVINVFGKGNRKQDFIGTSDIANAVLECLNKIEDNGIYNIASGNPISMKELARLICSKYKSTLIFTGEDINEMDNWNISIEKAKSRLNFKPKYTSKEVLENLLKNNF